MRADRDREKDKVRERQTERPRERKRERGRQAVKKRQQQTEREAERKLWSDGHVLHNKDRIVGGTEDQRYLLSGTLRTFDTISLVPSIHWVAACTFIPPSSPGRQRAI